MDSNSVWSQCLVYHLAQHHIPSQPELHNPFLPRANLSAHETKLWNDRIEFSDKALGTSELLKKSCAVNS